MREIRLDGSGTSCVLDYDEDGWCEVELRTPERTVLMGVQSIRYFASRIIDFIERPREGRQWVLFLLGQNVYAHGERLKDFRFLVFSDETGNFIGGVTISPAQQRAWLDALSPFVKRREGECPEF